MLIRRSSSARAQYLAQISGKTILDDIKTTERALRRYSRRYNEKKRNLPWQSPGAVVETQQYERGVRFRCENAWVELQWLAADCLRVRLRQEDGDFRPSFSYAISKIDWLPVTFEATEREDSVEIRSAGMLCRIGKQSFRIVIDNANGKRICLDTEGMAWQDNGRLRLAMGLHPDEMSYGLGQRASRLNLRGKQYVLRNEDPESEFDTGTDPLYSSVPFYLGVHENIYYGVFWENSSYGSVDIGATSTNELVFEADSGELRYYIFAGRDLNAVLTRYMELTGSIKLPPMWSLGYQQSRFSYFPQDRVLELAEEFRQREIPCDAIHLNMHYSDGFRPFTISQRNFPALARLVNELDMRGFKALATLIPAIKVDPQYQVHKRGDNRNAFLKYPDGEPVTVTSWSGICNLPDFTNPAARAWWNEELSTLTQVNVAGLVNEYAEPSVFGKNGSPTTLPDAVRHDRDGLGSTHLEQHNVYSLLMARASYEALRKQRPDQRVVNYARSGYAGSQRYAMTWTGSNSATWEHLRLSLSMVLNMSLSGLPLTGVNIGGFYESPDAELFTRWLQAACFLPVFRSDTDFNTPPQEPWAFGQPYEAINRQIIQLRYKLLPYLYAVIAQAREYGLPVIRPLFMSEPDNPRIRALDDAYLVGDALLVAPVLEAGAIKRQVYLPEGAWFDFWTNELIIGKRTVEVVAPLERLPLFVKAGATLPMWQEQQFVGEQTVDTLTLRIFPGELETILYEDAGEGNAYEQGDYRWVYVTCRWEGSQFIINRRTAGRFVPSYDNVRVEVMGLRDEPGSVHVDRQGAPLWFYDDDRLEISTDDSFYQIKVVGKPSPTDATILHRPW